MVSRGLVACSLVGALGFGCGGPTGERPEDRGQAAGALARIARAFPYDPTSDRLALPPVAAVDDRTHRAHVSLPPYADGDLHLEDPRTGLSISVRLEGTAHVRGDVVDGYVVYPGALDGGDLVHRRSETGTEDWFAFWRRPRAEALRYEIELGRGVRGLRLVAGVLEMLDASGTPRLRMGPASGVDAGGRRFAMVTDIFGCAVDRSPSAPWGRAVVDPAAPRCTVVMSAPAGLAYPVLVDPPWSTTASMTVARHDFSLAALGDGRVLAAGGSTPGNLAEIYDPSSETWAATAPLPVDRSRMELTSLDDGRVLASGGLSSASFDEIETYDPISGAWTPHGVMSSVRARHTATRMADGRVLIVGGQVASQTGTALVDIFDPATNTLTPAAPLPAPRREHAAALLGDGKVLVVAGIFGNVTDTATALLYDPTLDQWSTTGSLAVARASPTATELESGAVLVVGGSPDGIAPTEKYDPAGGTWSSAGSVAPGRAEHVTVALPGDRAVTAGGIFQGFMVLTSTQVYDGLAGWTSVQPLSLARRQSGVALLPDGAVLVAGGRNSNGVTIASCEVFRLLGDGDECFTGGECAGGNCVDGVCCDALCAGPCEACTAALKQSGSDGACGPIAAGTDPEAECLDDGAPACGQNGLCDGAGACAEYPVASGCEPAPCASDVDCASGHCDPDDSICCDDACSGACQACAAAKKGSGSDGVCGLVAEGTAPDLDCGPQTGDCSTISYCNDAGRCVPSDVVCAPYTCAGELGCAESCTTDDGCSSGFECDPRGVCVESPEPMPPPPACLDAVTASLPDGTGVSCAPYACAPEMGCLTRCASIDDCASPGVCDTAGACVERPAPVDEGAACSCQVVGTPRRPTGAWMSVVVALLAAGIRLRRPIRARAGARSRG